MGAGERLPGEWLTTVNRPVPDPATGLATKVSMNDPQDECGDDCARLHVLCTTRMTSV